MTDDTHASQSDLPGETVEDEDFAEAIEAEAAPAPEAAGQPAQPNPLAAVLAAAEQERDDLKNQLLRALAETDNVRKRANRQIADEKVYAVERFARDLLNVSDNLNRALDSMPPENRGFLPDSLRNFIEGVELTQKELVAVLSRHGVKPVDANPGADFDPMNHQAVTQIPSEYPPGTVASTFQTGWKIGDRTLRAAMVAVSAGPVSN